MKDRRPLLVDPRSYRVRMMARTTTMTGGEIKEKKRARTHLLPYKEHREQECRAVGIKVGKVRSKVG